MTQWQDLGYEDSDCWHDSMLVCCKSNHGLWQNKKNDLKRWLKHCAITMDIK
jgi:hypothetical protein